MRRYLAGVASAIVLAGALLLASPGSASANGCISWSEAYGCEASIACLIVTETHGYCIIYYHRAGTIGFEIF
jgi:hypothetical protein